MKKSVVIASRNPVKIQAVKDGFGKMFAGADFEFVGVSATSGVADQPMSSDEALRGAMNRALNARELLEVKAEYYVGIEGGVEFNGAEMEAFAWVVVMSDLKIGKARSATFFLPEKIVKLIGGGMELGEADDVVFKRSNSKQDNGAVGILTGNVIDRTKCYTEAVVLALIPFVNEELY